jgi:hypothetical protein
MSKPIRALIVEGVKDDARRLKSRHGIRCPRQKQSPAAGWRRTR